MNPDRFRNLLAERIATAARGGPLRIPEPGQRIVAIFMDLSATRTFHAAGPNPISYAEVEAYARLTQTPLRPDDVRLIRRLDDAWIAAVYARRESGNVMKMPTGSGAELTPAIFDAVIG